MKLFRYFLPLVAACLTATSAFGHEDGATTERDTQAMQQFMRAKRSMSLDDLGGKLAISGDIRFEWQNIREKINNGRVRGSGSGENTLRPGEAAPGFARFGSNEYDIEFNLYFDYTAENSWATVQLQFDNDMGTAKCCDYAATIEPEGPTENDDARYKCESGFSDNICLKRAYFGYNIFEDGCSRLDIEVGRRNFYHVFDSRVQFENRFDGILVRYANSFECVGDFYANGGVFVTDSVIDNYGWIIELGFMDIMDWGLDVKYSYVDWDFGGVDRNGSLSSESRCHRMFESRNSQLSAAWHWHPECFCSEVTIYGAFVHNHAAKRRPETNDKKENNAWYLGVMLGKVKKQGDWAIDINYQLVEAQAIMDCDISGIGRGNVLNQCFVDGTPSSEARGNGNYKGFLVETMYALTDNIVINAEFEWSDEENSSIGGTHDYRKFELEFVYAW